MNEAVQQGRILLTGATGFVGAALARHLARHGQALVCTGRRAPPDDLAGDVSFVPTGELAPDTRWEAALTGVDCVVHCAARVHVMDERAGDPLAAFRRVNVAATLNLARQAAAAGVRQFVFISSVKVNGESSLPGQPFTETSAPAPQDAYGISKLEAETALLQLGRASGMAVTVIRPPLVYGPGVKANFLSMLKVLRRGLPLPLGRIDNRRSLVYVENLVSLIHCCLRQPLAYGEVFLVADGTDVSTTHLLRSCAAALQVPARLWPLPAACLRAAASLLGKPAAADRLCQSLQVDIGKARTRLGWTPPYTLEQGLHATVAALKN